MGQSTAGANVRAGENLGALVLRMVKLRFSAMPWFALGANLNAK